MSSDSKLMDYTEFWTICSANGIVLDVEQIRSVKRFVEELRYWNEKVNLLSRKEIDEVLNKHILHSLSILKYVEIKQKARCLDVGTGGGFPGIPLIIAKPDLYMTLIDSIRKKVNITEMLAKHTNTRHVETICGRAEDLAKNKLYNNHFDFVFSRAVSRTNDIITWTKKLLKKDGKIVLLKGGNLDDEISEAKKNFPNVIIKEQLISVFGDDSFSENEKKVLICSF